MPKMKPALAIALALLLGLFVALSFTDSPIYRYMTTGLVVLTIGYVFWRLALLIIVNVRSRRH
ncbi:hypothetical protein [Schleiferilactobacillus shenzhenensis]|uniref:Uncharacterized protein n=1 Tax=Schleiferilactobacillus shenzhenensis LY-73 TaxID=1231336 RepID=U4TVI6_9LACO|nr:hypothetical protein [Schleiferilactobacillus shenzhenensis]ERL65402.1 hypothetical protein L248_2801 [Schleiferilactobacillus shenzhenensis LY-73]